MDYKYSIIIPHYNTPDLLKRLLYSIPERDYIQVIVVDDCSPEEARRDLSKLKKTFDKVEFYSTRENRGGGKARNIGVTHAQGECLIFADSDDFFTPGFGKILDTYSSDNPYDIVFFNNCSVDSETYEPTDRVSYLTKVFKQSKTDKVGAEKVFRFLFGEPWCKIVKRKLIEGHNIQFDETPIHNDTRFSYLIGYYADKVEIDPRIGYCITERRGSVSKQINEDNLIVREKVFSIKNRFLKDHKVPIIDPGMFSPFVYALKRRKKNLSKTLFDLAKKAGYSKFAILKNYIVCTIKKF